MSSTAITRATKTAAARLSARYRHVSRVDVRRAGDWWVVEATVCGDAYVQCVRALAPTLDQCFATLGV